MIAAVQLQRRLKRLLTSWLQSGTIPTVPWIAKALMEEVPTPGQAAFTTDIPNSGDVIDADRYTAVWQGILDDLADLYAGLAQQLAVVTAAADRMVATSSYLNVLSAGIMAKLAALAIPPTALARLQTTFHSSTGIDTDSTTCTVDYREGKVTLAPITTLTSHVLVGARVEGQALTGLELPLAFSPLTRLLDPVDHHAWMTQVDDSGGGTSYQLTLTFPTPRVVNALKVEVTHTQTVQLLRPVGVQNSADPEWVPYDPQAGAQTLSGLRIILTMATGQPVGNGKFRYTFGISSIKLDETHYQADGTLLLQEWTVPRQDQPFSRVLLSPTSTTPPGTDITYTISAKLNDTAFSDPPITNVTITPGSVFLLGNVVPTQTLLSTTTADTTHPLLQATLPIGVSRSLNAPGNGIFLGAGQWRLEQYSTSWGYQPNVLPGPGDWDPLPLGVFPEEIITSYPNVARGVEGVYLTRMDLLPTPEIVQGQALRWTLSLYTTAAFTATTLTDPSGFPWSTGTESILDFLAQPGGKPLGLHLAPYLNGKALTQSLAGLKWPFKAGWNTIIIYGSCPTSEEELHLPNEILITGFSLTPASFPGYTPDANDYDTASSGLITSIQPDPQPLTLVSPFDLQYNTPLLYHGRCSVDEDGITVLVPSVGNDVNFLAAYDTAMREDLVTDTYKLQITANLSTTKQDSTPVLSALELLVS